MQRLGFRRLLRLRAGEVAPLDALTQLAGWNNVTQNKGRA